MQEGDSVGTVINIASTVSSAVFGPISSYADEEVEFASMACRNAAESGAIVSWARAADKYSAISNTMKMTSEIVDSAANIKTTNDITN
jgi:hypothetical protein